jgi:hypothetical protein
MQNQIFYLDQFIGEPQRYAGVNIMHTLDHLFARREMGKTLIKPCQNLTGMGQRRQQ